MFYVKLVKLVTLESINVGLLFKLQVLQVLCKKCTSFRISFMKFHKFYIAANSDTNARNGTAVCTYNPQEPPKLQ